MKESEREGDPLPGTRPVITFDISRHDSISLQALGNTPRQGNQEPKFEETLESTQPP